VCFLGKQMCFLRWSLNGGSLEGWVVQRLFDAEFVEARDTETRATQSPAKATEQLESADVRNTHFICQCTQGKTSLLR
jgi:hypothetical protein